MQVTTKKWIEAFGKRDVRALSRLISLAENADPDALAALEALGRPAKPTKVVGITGPPGAGKSSLINSFIQTLRRGSDRVAVLAVDPTSPVSGGAVLGDRIRMSEHFEDPNVFIRSVSTRGRLGGVSLATPQSVALCESFGFDWLFLESVGIGQNEIEVSRWSDVTVLVLTPDSGDGIQAIKAGVLEVADVILVNKNEAGRGEAFYRELEATFHESKKKMPALFLTSEKDPASREAAAQGIASWFQKNQALLKERRAGMAQRFARVLIENHGEQGLTKWLAAQKGTDPYALYRSYLALGHWPASIAGDGK